MAFTLFGIYVGGNFEWEEQIRLFGWALLYMVIVSYLVILVAPDYGISHDLHNGAWKGVFSHKNSLGRVIGFGTVFLIFARPKLGPTFLRIGLFAATALLLIFSDSSTALVAVIGCLAAYPCIYILRVRTRRTIPLWAVIIAPLVLALVLAAGNYGVVAGAFGKDPTLSGRTLLWKAVVDAIKQRPVWGYGYSVFWPKPGPETLKVAAAASMGEMPSHAHDGYLDLVLDLGVMGLLVFLYGLVKMIRLALAAVKDDSLTSGAWPLMFIVYFILFNLTESNLLISRAFLWLPFVSIYVALIQSRVLAPSYSRQDALSAEYAPAG
jgi:O-antigen ligase